MNTNHSASRNLNQYLESFKSRLQRLTLLNGLAKLAIAVVVVCLLAAWLVSSGGFNPTHILFGRLAILVTLAAGFYGFIWLPRKQLAGQIPKNAEGRVAAFAGRLTTWNENRNDPNPVNELLAEDTLAIAGKHAVNEVIPAKEMGRAGGAVAGAALVLLLTLIAGPAMTNHSLRHLLAGWATSDGLLPPQTLAVTPGSTTVRFGSNVMIEAAANGFNPDDTQINIKSEGESWQTLSMTKAASGGGTATFDFSLFAVREPLEYYVTAGGVRSPGYKVEVVELPNISDLKLSYDYPDWTGLETEEKSGGDIDALPGTNISLEVTTDQPLPAGVLVLDDNAQPLALDGVVGTAQFEVTQAGEYYLAATMGSEQVRLTDNFFIRTTEDGKPKIEFTAPGGDWRATNIEEVTTELKLVDDYGVESVGIRYAVNGGDWQDVALSGDKRDATMVHLFFLEDLGNDGELLQAGDLISYYAVATDREQTVQTDIFFVEVQPFDRRFSQSQQAGGGAGGRGGQGQNEREISQKQREIIISTWNLSREQEEISAAGDDEKMARITDNARLLSSLQKALAEQAASLVDTARSRMLDQDERVNTFIQHMDAAITAMQPASEELANIDLAKAMKPEQEALQHLLRADAVYNDIQVSTAQGGRGQGGGGQAARELTEMFELEIDLDQNQYETGSTASLETLQQESEQSMDDLSDLARRQEQLARTLQGQNDISDAQRWQQEMLRREAEELKERLEQQQLQRGASGQSQSSDGASSSGQSSDAAGGEATASNSSDSVASLDEISRRMDSAIDAMDRASEAMQSGDRQQIEQASGEAQRQLEGAGEQMASEQQQSIQRSFDDMADRANQLARDQQRIEQKLLDGIQEALAAAPEDAEEIDNPFTFDEELAMAEQKKDINARLQRLQIDMNKNANAIKSEDPGTARKLEQANDNLREAEIGERIDNAIEYMSQGASLYVANSESMVTRELDNLSEDLQEARDQYARGGEGNSELDKMLTAMGAATDTLQEALERGAGEPSAAGEAQAGEGQRGQGQESGNAQSGEGEQNAAGGGNQRNNRGGAADGRWQGWGRGIEPLGDSETQILDQQIRQAANNAGRLLPELESRGVTDGEIAGITELIQELQNATFNADQSQTDYLDALAVLQQLQKNIAEGLAGDTNVVRSENPDVVPADYQEAVAEYYRRLSADEPANNSNE